MVVDTLEELGLSEKEITVFKTVLEYGKLSPARISSLANINRTTVYAVAKDLVQKGYLFEDSLKGGMYYSPTSPKDLVKITKKERQALIQKELLLEELAKEVQEVPRSKTYAVPKIRFIEGKENVIEFLYNRTSVWVQSSTESEKLWLGYQDQSYFETDEYRAHVGWFWNQPMSKGVTLKLLSNDSETERQIQKTAYPRRHIKFWKENFRFRTSQWIVGDYSILFQTREKPHYLVETYDAVYCRDMRELFKNLWEEID